MEKKLYVAINGLLNCYIFIKGDKMSYELTFKKSNILHETLNTKIIIHEDEIYLNKCLKTLKPIKIDEI